MTINSHAGAGEKKDPQSPIDADLRQHEED